MPCVRLHPPFEGFQPRAATGYFVSALAKIAENFGLAEGLVDKCAENAAQIEGEMPLNLLQTLGNSLIERTPVFYAAGPRGAAIARIAKIKVNENAKRPAFWAALPEMNHNELVGYTLNADGFVAVLIEDADDPPRLSRRFQVMAETLSTAGVTVSRLRTPSHLAPLARALVLLMAIDRLTVELAVRAGVDPNAVALIEQFKRAL